MRRMLTFTMIFLVAVSLHWLLESWLEHRHANHVLHHRHAVPVKFAGQVPLAAHQKAADYTIAKLRLGRWAGLYSVAILLMWTLGGGLQWLDTSLAGLGWSSMLTGIAFLLVFMLLGTLIDLPFDLYGTFKVEQRFGFNRMTLGLYFTDMLKQAVLTLAIGAPVIWVILWLMDASGSLWWLYAWLVWTAFMLLMIWAYPTFIAPLFNKFEPLPEGEVKARIEALLERCGFASNGLFVMDGSRRSAHGNAYFTGLGSAKRIVFFDTLLKQLQPVEIEAVLAHELGHFKHKHVTKRLIMMIAMTLAGFAMLGWLAGQDWFYQGLGIATPSHHALLVLFLLVIPHFTFFLTPLMSLSSRKHEFEADAYAAEHAEAQALISALVKMYEDNAATLTPDPLYSAWHDSHPPAPVRIAHLEKLI